MGRKEAIVAVQNALKRGPFSLLDIAKRADLPYETVRKWAIGERNPRPANMVKILAALDEQADQIKQLVREARDAAP